MSQPNGKLLFPVEKYSLDTLTVKTTTGEKTVVYRSYMHVPYIEKPVNKDYQSLNVYMPVKINNEAINAENAPILFSIGVGGYISVNNARTVSTEHFKWNYRDNLALAAGYVVIAPGCRGRENQYADGSYYGKAPAAIVDLKAAVKYIRHNKGIIPGNTDWIISEGCSAGGALSALLGASGNSSLYDKYFMEIGVANASDDIFASACYSPITDLEHADMAYEWMYGIVPDRMGLVDQKLSGQLKLGYTEYQLSLNLNGKDSFGVLTAENYGDYLLKYYLTPSANDYLSVLQLSEREKYLMSNKWLTWKDDKALFDFDSYNAHVGRMKGLPAFDDFDMKQPEPILFGNDTTNARHFTNFSLQYSTGDKEAEIDEETVHVVNLMNAMYFVLNKNNECAGYWWLRNGTSDNHTSQTVMINLATALENINKKVDARLFWDGGHCADYEPEGFIKWIADITGHSLKYK